MSAETHPFLLLAALAVGLTLLAGGGELLVRGALAVGRRLGLSPLLAGLVIVGFGTSTPELAVSLDAAARGADDLALANVVGSNAGNILLILGLCAVITPLTVTPLALRRDGWAMLGATGLLLALLGGGLMPWEGGLLLAALAGYLVVAWRSESRAATPEGALHAAEAAAVTPARRMATGVVLVVAGLALLVAGARLLVEGASGLAEAAGIPPAVIGLTVVAVGTSLPELAVSLTAALRGSGDVAVGNILGSNLFNALGVLGAAALVAPLQAAPRLLAVDQWVMLAAAAALVLFLYTGHRLGRREGAALLAAWLAWVAAMAVWP
ncbi:cation:H+ antiporter [Thiohalospira halophila DSM 15071]|uniref:Cation:H+ antiporter n=1 Tax=Thiohalospira halophila DSM 15071 TaxID=1123397 RepID=A0A1I1T874_9GAMM|nr:calcium/sodium antiporter [Thiohalospira halophila]SFD54792.1 cation:H+ antiporter [Thiohalospira halophila DSM 15071]